jgi:hypothetical protein
LTKEIVERVKGSTIQYFQQMYKESSIDEIKQFVPRMFTNEKVNLVCEAGRRLFSIDPTLQCRSTVSKIRHLFKDSDKQRQYRITSIVKDYLMKVFPLIQYRDILGFLSSLFKCVDEPLKVCQTFKETFGQDWNIPSNILDSL